MSSTTSPSADLVLGKLQPELFPDERLLWHGRPTQGWIKSRLDPFSYAFGLVLIVISMLPAYTLWVTNREFDEIDFLDRCFACAVFSFMILSMGLFLAGGGKWLDARTRKHLFYGVTNERLVAVRERTLGWRVVYSLRLRDAPYLTVIHEIDGTGSIVFLSYSPPAPNKQVPVQSSFYMIPDVRAVYSLIRTAQRGRDSDCAARAK